MSDFKPVIQIGFDRGEIDFRVSIDPAYWGKRHEFISMTFWALKQWIDTMAHIAINRDNQGQLKKDAE